MSPESEQSINFFLESLDELILIRQPAPANYAYFRNVVENLLGQYVYTEEVT